MKNILLLYQFTYFEEQHKKKYLLESCPIFSSFAAVDCLHSFGVSKYRNVVISATLFNELKQMKIFVSKADHAVNPIYIFPVTYFDGQAHFTYIITYG